MGIEFGGFVLIVLCGVGLMCVVVIIVGLYDMVLVVVGILVFGVDFVYILSGMWLLVGVEFE